MNNQPDWTYNSTPYTSELIPFPFPDHKPLQTFSYPRHIIDLTSDNDDDDNEFTAALPPKTISRKRSRLEFEKNSTADAIDLTDETEISLHHYHHHLATRIASKNPKRRKHPQFEPSHRSDSSDPNGDEDLSSRSEADKGGPEEHSFKRSRNMDPYGPPNPVDDFSRPVYGHLQRELDLERDIEDLKAQVRELHGFVIEQGLLSKTPPSIRTQLEKRLNATQELATTIRNSILIAYQQIRDSEGDQPPRRSGITSDDYSDAMCDFIPDISRLSKYPDGLTPAFDLLIFLAEHSYSNLDDGGSGEGGRGSDQPVDDLLCELGARRIGSQGWFPEKAFVEKLRGMAEMLDSYGIEGFLGKGIQMLAAFQQGDVSL